MKVRTKFIILLLMYTSIIMGQINNKYLLGTTYYPQWWSEINWDTDFKKMSEIGFNVVRMGDLAWSSFEPKEGEYNFEWMDKAIKVASKYDLKVILCTPTASIPPWLFEKYPDVLSGNENGNYNYGSRKGHNTNSENLLNASDKITTAISNHYINNENIIGWQLDNEPGYPFTMYDDLSKIAFQNWLKNKYKTIDSLNYAWQSVFWSLTYTNWSQIHLPPLNRADGDACPSQQLDYRRFFSWSFQQYLIRQQQILKKTTHNKFITTNWPNTHWSIDIFESAKFLDFCGWDSYMEYAGINDFRSQYEATIHHDLCRTTNANQIFIVSEEAAQANTWASPKGVRLKMLMDFAHGSYGTLIYEWKPPLGGAEQGFSSVLQIDGSEGVAYNNLKQACHEINELSPFLLNAKIKSNIALLFSYNNQWNKGFWGSNKIRGYDENISLFYKGLKALKQNIDLISETSNFNSYKIIAIPGLQILSDSLANKLNMFVLNGGIIIIDNLCGSKNTNNCFRSANSWSIFADMSGITVPIIDNKVYGEAKNIIKIDFNNIQFQPYSYINKISLNKAKSLAVFKGGNLDTMPAITLNYWGKGGVIYVGADSKDVAFYESLALQIGKIFNIKPILEAPLEVEVVSRFADGKEYIFVSNLIDKPVTITLPKPMYEMISKKIVNGNIELNGLDVLVLEQK